MSDYNYVLCDIYTVAKFQKIDLYMRQINAETNEIWKTAKNAIQKHDILSHSILL